MQALEVPPQPAEIAYCIESTACYHLPVILCFGGRPMVVNPLLANPSRRKTDKLDARLLAQHAMTGLWPESYVVPIDVQRCRLHLHQRRRLVRERTRLTNVMNNTVLRFGHTVGAHAATQSGSNLGGKMKGPTIWPIFEALADGKLPNMPGVSSVPIPADVGAVMRIWISRVEQIHTEVMEQNKLLMRAVKATEFVCGGGEITKGAKLMKHLMTIPGVGELTAATWLSQVGDATRFQHPQQAAAFCGYDPSLKVSAGKTTGHTRRKGNRLLHFLIGQLSSTLIDRRKEPLGQWAFQITQRHRKGGRRRAKGALGRRIAIALWVVHRDQVDFDYGKYSFWRAPEVPLVPIEDMGFAPRYLKVLVANGYATSAELVEAFASGALSQKKGIGEKCLALLHQWITAHKRASSSAGKSSAGQSDTLGMTIKKLSRTELCSTGQSQTSPTGSQRRTSTSARRS